MSALPDTTTQKDTATVERLCPMYRVLIHNDDITPMDFVVGILLDIFKKELQPAVQIMYEAHTNGLALVTVLPLEQAEHRIEQAHALARPRKFPLTFTCEPE